MCRDGASYWRSKKRAGRDFVLLETSSSTSLLSRVSCLDSVTICMERILYKLGEREGACSRCILESKRYPDQLDGRVLVSFYKPHLSPLYVI